jgi:tetratricopeptide (TPR) repeat protein
MVPKKSQSKSDEKFNKGSILTSKKKPFRVHSRRIAYLIVIGIVAGLASLLYLNSFQVPWQFDDRPNIVDNRTVHFHTFSPDRLLRLLTNSYSESIRFFSYFTFAVNFYFGGLNVFGYHLVNLLIHIAAGILVFWFIFLTLNLPSQKGRYDSIRFKVAFLTSLIFIAHPIQTQSVTYIVQRMTSMASMFYLLSMVLYIKGRLSSGRSQILYYGGMGLSGLLSIFSKENAFVLPIFVAMYEVFFFREWEGKSIHRPMLKISLVLLGFGLIGWVLLAGKYINVIEEGYRYRDFTMSERVLTQLRVVLHYLTLLIYPHPSRLNLDYDFPVSKSLFDPISTIFSLIAILFFMGMGILKMKKWPVLSFFIFWYFGNLVIESSILPLEMVYEHRLYLPSIGPIFLFSLLLIRVWERWVPIEKRKREVIFAGLVILMVFPLSWSTIERNSVWRSEFELWTDCVKKSPHKGRPHYNLGYYYYTDGQVKKAVEEFELALKFDPKMAPAHFNLGVIDYNEGRLDEAADRFEKALAIYPQYAQAYAYLGEVYNRKGKSEGGLAEFKKASKIDPNNIEALNHMGMVYLKSGDLGRALIEFKKVLIIDPNDVEVLVNLGEIYIKEGRADQAFLEIQKALQLNPNYGYAHTLSGMIYLQKGMIDEGISAFHRALEIDPNDVVSLTNLGVAYRYKGMVNEALSQFQKVLSIRPNDEEAHVNLGEVYLARGNMDEAIRENEKALQINPRAIEARFNLGEAYFKQGRLDQAIFEWKKILEINPREGKTHHSLAAAYYAKREFRLAIKHLDEASALGFKVHPQLAEWLKSYR